MKKKKIVSIISILFVIAILLLFIPFFIQKKVKKDIYYNLEIPNKEFAIVLGAGVHPDGGPSLYLKKRLDDALLLYNNQKVDKLLLTGDNSKAAYDEISVMNNYLVERGVPQEKIFGDYAGFDTYSSFARAQSLFDIKSAIVITQKFHLPRALFIAKYKDIDAIGFTSSPRFGHRSYYIREWGATIKSFFDCLRNRKPKFGGEKINTNGNSNILLEQLK